MTEKVYYEDEEGNQDPGGVAPRVPARAVEEGIGQQEPGGQVDNGECDEPGVSGL